MHYVGPSSEKFLLNNLIFLNQSGISLLKFCIFEISCSSSSSCCYPFFLVIPLSFFKLPYFLRNVLLLFSNCSLTSFDDSLVVSPSLSVSFLQLNRFLLCLVLPLLLHTSFCFLVFLLLLHFVAIPLTILACSFIFL